MIGLSLALTRPAGRGYGLYADNLITAPDDFTNAAWTKTNVTTAADAVAAPDGTLTADRMLEAAVSGQHSVDQSIAINGQPVLEVFALAAERSVLWLYSNHLGAGRYFDLSSGSLGSIIGTGANIRQARIVPAGGGWYRCALALASANTTNTFRIGVSSADGTLSYAGDTAKGLYIWRAQASYGNPA